VPDPNNNDRSGVFEPASAAIAGSNHRLSLKVGGTAWAYGPDNSSGQQGNGTTTASQYPQAVVGVNGTGQLVGVTLFGAGNSFSLALVSSGVVYSWGDNSLGQLGNGTTLNSSIPRLASTPVIAQVAAC
jgi:alpha-tubulin suppressor-like RCC1 family protein